MRGIAGRRHAISGEFRHFLRAAVFRWIPDGPHVQQLGGVPHKGRGLLVVCGAGFAGHLTAENVGDACRGAVRGGALHRLLHKMAVIGVEHLLVLLRGLVQFLGSIGGCHPIDDMQGVLHAVVRNGGVALRQIPHGDGVDAQNVVRGGFVDVFLNAGLMRDLCEVLGAKMSVHFHEHGVHRVGGGLVQVDVTPVVAERVRHLCSGSRSGFEGESGIAVEQGAEVHA